jgi:hypothetical protein
MYCHQCGAPLEHFDGEGYSSDCTHFEAVAQLHQTTDEALGQLTIDQAEADVGDGTAKNRPS